MIKGGGVSILSYKTANALGPIKVIKVTAVSSTTVSSTPQCLTVAQELVDGYPELFQTQTKQKKLRLSG